MPECLHTLLEMVTSTTYKPPGWRLSVAQHAPVGKSPQGACKRHSRAWSGGNGAACTAASSMHSSPAHPSALGADDCQGQRLPALSPTTQPAALRAPAQ